MKNNKSAWHPDLHTFCGMSNMRWTIILIPHFQTVLENYLDRSISFTELWHDDLSQPRDARGWWRRDQSGA